VPQTWVDGSTSDDKITSLPLMTRLLILGLADRHIRPLWRTAGAADNEPVDDEQVIQG